MVKKINSGTDGHDELVIDENRWCCDNHTREREDTENKIKKIIFFLVFNEDNFEK